LNTASEEPLTIRRVPAGYYQATFESNLGLFRYPSKEQGSLAVSVSPDQITRVTINFRGVGAIVVDAVRRNGVRYDGSGRVVLRSSAGIRKSVAFLGPPYFIEALPPDTYEVEFLAGLREYPVGAVQMQFETALASVEQGVGAVVHVAEIGE
jgi:hypothetical protein